MDRMLNFFSRYWRLMLVGLFVGLLAYILLFRGLHTLLNNYSQTELISQHDSRSLRVIIQDPINAPYKVLVWAGLKLGHHSILVTRIAASIIAGFVAILFYWVALHWYSKRVALLASILFVSSSSYLHIGRYGTALILQMATLVLISCVFLYRRTQHETLVAYLLVAVLAASLYIPGIIWFELIGLWLLRKRMVVMLTKQGLLHATLIFALGVFLLLPLMWAAVHNNGILRDIFGLPAALLTPQQLFKNLLHLGSSVIYRGYWPTEYWLHGAPLLNIGEVVVFIAGLSQLVKRPILRANYFLLGALIIGTALVILGGSVTIALLTPLIYLTIAGGIYYLLDQWLTIFPRNPIARFVGFCIIFVFASFSAIYHTRAYFSAWPNAVETKAVYTVKQPN